MVEKSMLKSRSTGVLHQAFRLVVVVFFIPVIRLWPEDCFNSDPKSCPAATVRGQRHNEPWHNLSCGSPPETTSVDPS